MTTYPNLKELRISYNEALAELDTLMGTGDVTRKTERLKFGKPYTPKKQAYTITSKKDRFWIDVLEISDVLEPDGSYYTGNGYERDHVKIAAEMVNSGITWVTPAKVRKAQKVVEKRNR